ncbi:MAG TPA: hypothetical protein VNU92_00305 [Edaphobacter sp.]|jgi:ribonuclease T2|nr:hypothetical protein [Edaphobacter sp.]
MKTSSLFGAALFGVAFVVLVVLNGSVWGQEKGEPGKFDFYLLNLAWGPEFCSIQGTSAACKAPRGFVVHGLWAQNNDGSYPVFCGERPGPARPERNLDITPDAPLLEHEWSKHGTCTTVSPEDFFSMERTAFRSVRMPKLFDGLDHEVTLTPAEIVDSFAEENPSFPAGSFVVTCAKERLTAIEACFSKDGLKPIGCAGLRGCDAKTVRVSMAAGK